MGAVEKEVVGEGGEMGEEDGGSGHGEEGRGGLIILNTPNRLYYLTQGEQCLAKKKKNSRSPVKRWVGVRNHNYQLIL